MKKKKFNLRFWIWIIIIIIFIGLLYICSNDCVCNPFFDNVCLIFKKIHLTKSSFSLLIAIFSLIISIIGFRFQILSMINKQLNEMADLCNTNIDTLLRENSQSIIRTTQNISHLISTIIAAKQMLDALYKNYRFFLLNLGKQSCIDLFYLRLHSSIRDYLFKHKLPEDIDKVFQGTDDNLKPKIRKQILDSYN